MPDRKRGKIERLLSSLPFNLIDLRCIQVREMGGNVMIRPSIDVSTGKPYNRFALCIIVGKRARELINGSPARAACKSKNPVSIAINELNEGKLQYEAKKF